MMFHVIYVLPQLKKGHLHIQGPREWAAMTTLYSENVKADTGESGCPEFHGRDIKFRDPSWIFLLPKGG